MTQQRILWTTFPNGARPLDDGNVELRFSVMASPRLTSEPTDSGFLLPDFSVFGDWPSYVSEMGFDLEVRVAGSPATQYSAPFDPSAAHAPNSATWKALFDASTPVATHDFDDHSGDLVLSYTEEAINTYLEGVYATTALVSQASVPTVGEWLGDSGLPDLLPLGRLDRSGIAAEIREMLAAKKAVTLADVDTPLKQATLHEMFLGGSSPMETSVPAVDPPETPDFDFHEAVAVASQYPMLQRLLGLVVDLVAVVPADVVGAGEFDVRAVPLEDPSDVQLRPWTRARIGRTVFEAKPVDPALFDDRKLMVGDGSRFAPITLDLDGATMKLLGHAGSIANSTNPLTPEGLAALRTGGIGLAMKDRGKALADALQRAKDTNTALLAGGDVVLFAEDLLRGFRIDVWEHAFSRWSSLMRRAGSLTVGQPPSDAIDAVSLEFPLADEGVVSTNPTENPAEPGVLKLPESLFAWTGWSLATDQPGKVLGNPSANGQGDVVEDPASVPQEVLDVTVEASPAPGSLPVLRFGHEYRLRARTVDAAGNGPAFDEDGPDEGHATAGFRYRRFEPVAAPEVLLVGPRTEGETIERIVIRSEGPDDVSGDKSERHIAPAKSSWQMAELHGLFDRTAGGRIGPDPAKYATLAPREKGGFGARTGADGVETVTHPQAVLEPNTAGDMYYYPAGGGLVEINYLPDYLARGATLVDLPGTTATGVIKYDRYSFDPFDEAGTRRWPDYRPVRFALVGGADAPSLGSDRVLHVFLPKAEVAEVRLSGNLVEGDQELLAVYGWVEKKVKEVFGEGPYLDALRQGAEAGLLWELTPYRTLTLVHAVRVPLKAPRIGDAAVLRLAGETNARIVATVDFDRKSTSQVDVVGSWTECIDDPSVPITDPATQFERPASAPAFSVDADRLTGAADELDDSLQLADLHEFGDTKHRHVAYQATAISRFTEYFVERIAHTTQNTPTPGEVVPLGKPVVPGSVVVKTQDGGVTYQEGRDYAVDAGTGTVSIKVRNKLVPPGGDQSGVPVQTELDISFLPVPHSVTGEAAGELVVPSSARPEPPRVAYVIPTFAWSEPPGRDVTSLRLGKSLRIYLDRPWYSSGCGEQLGVVFWSLPRSAASTFPDAPYHVTHWALDPLYNGPPLPSEWPGALAFPGATIPVGPDSQPRLFELPEFREAETHRFVGVAAYDVQFDVATQRWFCDVTLETGFAYSPFVRLALVRYQEHSVPGMELSQVARADYAQVAPDRAVSLSYQGSDRVIVTLVGVDGPTSVGPGVADAWVEEKDPLVTSDDLGWERTGGIASLTRSAFPGAPALFTQWQGRVKLRNNGRRRRIVVQQFEQFQSEPTGLLVNLQRRLVHSDVIEI